MAFRVKRIWLPVWTTAFSEAVFFKGLFIWIYNSCKEDWICSSRILSLSKNKLKPNQILNLVIWIPPVEIKFILYRPGLWNAQPTGQMCHMLATPSPKAKGKKVPICYVTPPWWHVFDTPGMDIVFKKIGSLNHSCCNDLMYHLKITVLTINQTLDEKAPLHAGIKIFHPSIYFLLLSIGYNYNCSENIHN